MLCSPSQASLHIHIAVGLSQLPYRIMSIAGLSALPKLGRQAIRCSEVAGHQSTDCNNVFPSAAAAYLSQPPHRTMCAAGRAISVTDSKQQTFNLLEEVAQALGPLQEVQAEGRHAGPGKRWLPRPLQELKGMLPRSGGGATSAAARSREAIRTALLRKGESGLLCKPVVGAILGVTLLSVLAWEPAAGGWVIHTGADRRAECALSSQAAKAGCRTTTFPSVMLAVQASARLALTGWWRGSWRSWGSSRWLRCWMPAA